MQASQNHKYNKKLAFLLARSKELFAIHTHYSPIEVAINSLQQNKQRLLLTMWLVQKKDKELLGFNSLLIQPLLLVDLLVFTVFVQLFNATVSNNMLLEQSLP